MASGESGYGVRGIRIWRQGNQDMASGESGYAVRGVRICRQGSQDMPSGESGVTRKVEKSDIISRI